MSTSEFEKFWQDQKDKRVRIASMASGKKTSYQQSQGTGSRRPAWAVRRSDFLKVGDDQVLPLGVPTRIRLIAKNEEAWYHYMNRWTKRDGRYSMVISNSHNGAKKVPDVLYYYAIEEENGDLWAQDSFVATVLVLENFFKTMHTSASGKEYPKFIRSLGTDARGNSLDPIGVQGNEIVFGRKLHWTLSKAQKRIFEESLSRMSETCASCKSGTISTFAYSCPSCENYIASHKEGEISAAKEEHLRSREVECQGCGEMVSAIPEVECVKRDGYGSTARWSEGCDAPKSTDRFSIDLIVQAIPSGKGSSLEIIDFIPQLEDDRVKSWMVAPFDMDYLFGSMGLEDQAKSLGRENPFSSADQTLVDNMFVTEHTEEDEFSVPVEYDEKNSGINF